jgi:ADP-ribose pyrophosphatase YjhB (NUDIX family)
MSNLQSFQAKICYTAAGILIHEEKVLLVKHKKLGLWLNPGGHIEKNELPHQAAEREFFEETGVRVKAIELNSMEGGEVSEYLPNPICTNLHWISKENYWARVQGKPQPENKWKKGCEQHVSFLYLVRPVAGITLNFNSDETDGMEWFTFSQLAELELSTNVRQEIELGFQMVK